jgi:hypothetical protein
VNRARSRRPPIVFILLTLILLTMLFVTPLPRAVGATSATSGWSISPTVTPHMPDGALSGVSCWGVSFCMAVGEHYSDEAGNDVSLAERWDGTAWSIQHTPHPPGSQTIDLIGVACSAANSCIAVGSYLSFHGKPKTLAERWDGTVWTIQPTPNPLVVRAELSGVACTSSKACTAVGDYGDGYSSEPLAERWDGISWTIQPTPSSGQSARLSGVSCPTATWCIAVGSYSTTGNDYGLAERWNGTAWHIQPIPSPPGAWSSGLSAVSCTATSACTAVGGSLDGFPGVPLAERWDGTAWSIQSTPSPEGSNGGSSLSDVACKSATDCIAVGDYHGGLMSFTLVERWDGIDWSIQPSANKSRSSELSSVACVFVTLCTAVGDYWTGSAGATLAERWDGSSWSIQRTPNPSVNAWSELDGVACTSSSACVAVGAHEADGTDLTLIERWNGTAWSIQPSPNPPGPRGSSLSAVACTAATACTAVGYSADSLGAGTLAEQWDGTAWTIQPTPSPSEFAELTGVACLSATFCTAVGYHSTSDFGGDVALVEHWDGTSWTRQPVPNPGRGGRLSGVACSSEWACVAVGEYTNRSGKTVILIARWNGTTWTRDPAPSPSGTQGEALAGVDCMFTSSCTAVGYSYGAKQTTLVERWNGTTWSIQPSPNPSGAEASQLAAVACASVTTCTAVGEYFDRDASPSHVPLAEYWNGATWSIQPTPNPPHTGGGMLLGVACSLPTACIGVGFSFAHPEQVTLGERYSG